jgi:hypothetical protein
MKKRDKTLAGNSETTKSFFGKLSDSTKLQGSAEKFVLRGSSQSFIKIKGSETFISLSGSLEKFIRKVKAQAQIVTVASLEAFETVYRIIFNSELSSATELKAVAHVQKSATAEISTESEVVGKIFSERYAFSENSSSVEINSMVSASRFSKSSLASIVRLYASADVKAPRKLGEIDDFTMTEIDNLLLVELDFITK